MLCLQKSVEHEGLNSRKISYMQARFNGKSFWLLLGLLPKVTRRKAQRCEMLLKEKIN